MGGSPLSECFNVGVEVPEVIRPNQVGCNKGKHVWLKTDVDSQFPGDAVGSTGLS